MKLLFFMIATLFYTFIFVGLVMKKNNKRILTEKRLSSYINQQQKNPLEGESEEEASFYERVIRPLFTRLKKAIKLEERAKHDLEMKLRLAGNPFGMTAVDFKVIQLSFSILFFLSLFLLFFPAAEEKGKVIVFAVLAGGLGYFYPLYYLEAKKKQRVQLIQRVMPDFFDMVNVSLEAGLGLDGALSRVAKQMKGPLSEEFLQTLEEMKLGKTRREAFSTLRDRILVEEFQSLMNAMIQADQMGIGMTQVLRAQTVRIREQRRQMAREQSMKAPVKMLIPMILFIFPLLFIVLLGPIIITAVTEWF